jgi:hypothetical protein
MDAATAGCERIDPGGDGGEACDVECARVTAPSAHVGTILALQVCPLGRTSSMCFTAHGLHVIVPMATK